MQVAREWKPDIEAMVAALILLLTVPASVQTNDQPCTPATDPAQMNGEDHDLRHASAVTNVEEIEPT